MNEEIYEFSLGDFRCWAIKDIQAKLTRHELFPSATDEEIKAAAKRFGFDFEGTIELSATVLLIDTGQQKILCDSGSGVDTGEDGRLLSHLEALGIRRESIDILILSHAHGDHYGGILSGEGKLNFPNAKHNIWREEWEFHSGKDYLAFEEKNYPQSIIFRRKYFLPLAPHWHFLDEAHTEIAEGIRLIPAKGHSQHHLVIRLESQGKVLFFTGDSFVHPAYIENPNWAFPTDYDKEASIASRKALRKRIADEKALVLGYHFPFPSLGRIVAEGDKFIWQAL